MNMAPPAPSEERLARLQSYLSDDPKNETLRADIFDTALALGHHAIAQKQIDSALAELPFDLSWRHRQAVLYLAIGDYAEAEKSLRRLIADGASAPEIIYNLGYALFSQRNLELAADTLRPLLDSALDRVPGAMALWMRCRQPLGKLSEILDVFIARAASVRLPPEAWGVASLIGLDDERMADAKQWAEQGLRLDPKQRESLVTLGTLALAEQDSGKAQEYLQQCIALYPKDGRCWSALGLTYMLKGELDEAKTALENAVAFMPTHIGTWHALAWCQLAMKCLADAQKSFEHALELDRNFADSHGGLAVVLAQQGLKQSAQSHVERALRLDPRSLSALYAKAVIDGEVTDPSSFADLAKRLLGPRKSFSGKSILDEVLKKAR